MVIIIISTVKPEKREHCMFHASWNMALILILTQIYFLKLIYSFMLQ